MASKEVPLSNMKSHRNSKRSINEYLGSSEPDEPEKLHIASVIHDDWEEYCNLDESDAKFVEKKKRKKEMLDKITRFPKLKVIFNLEKHTKFQLRLLNGNNRD